MSQEKVSCPSCGETFEAEKSELYECPKCGTSIRPKSDEMDQDATQVFKV